MHTFATPEPITIEVRNATGDIRVELTDTTETTVEVSVVAGGAFGFLDEIARAFGGHRGTDPSDDEDRGPRPRWWDGAAGTDPAALLERVRVDMTRHDDGPALIVDTDPATRGWRTGFAITITAPTGSGVRIASQSADATITGTAARLEVRTASGDVVAGDVTGSALAHTASGDIRISSVGGELSCKSASGDVEVAAVAGAAVLHTTSGDVRVQAPAGDIQVRTVSGDVRIADAVTGTTDVTAVSGDVEIGLHAGSRAAVNLSTLSGDTRSDLSVTDQPGSAAADEQSEQPSGEQSDRSADEQSHRPAGDGPMLDIRVRTTSGDIRLRRAVTV